MNPKVDFFFEKAQTWQPALESLRALMLHCGLTEELKWGVPCYTCNGKNIALIHHFKDYCALLFFKGVLMRDDLKLLVQQTANVQATRQLRFTNESQISSESATIKAYIFEALEIEKAGLAVPLKTTADYEMPAEFKAWLEEDDALKKAFKCLTPGRQRGYLLFFAGAKQAKTREARIEKCRLQILACKGLND